MKVYIAGRITNEPNYEEKFERAKAYLEAQGHVVLSPCILPKGLTPGDYIRICLAMIDSAGMVYVLKNHQSSPGATIEVAYAKYGSKLIQFEK